MAITYDHLVEAGAPPVEEPLFYRISFRDESNSSLSVELRVRNGYNRLAGSKLLSYETVNLVLREPGEVLGAVVNALQHLHKEGMAAHAAAIAAADLVGDYAKGAAR